MNKSIDNFINDIFPLPKESQAQKAQAEWLWKNPWFGQDMLMTLNVIMAVEKIKELDKLDNNSPGFWYAVDFHMMALKQGDFEFKPTLH